MFERMSSRLWRMNDRIEASMYLLVGQDKAFLIDCGTGMDPVMPDIRKVTDLPVELLVTHAHPDHMGAGAEFDRVWLYRDEADDLEKLQQTVGAGENPPSMDQISVFDDRAVFDAGDLTVRFLPLEGHTPGSVVFICDEEKAVFCGDAIGSGMIVLMSIPEAWAVRPYLNSLIGFEQKGRNLEGYTWHGGHYLQSGIPGTPEFNPPTLKMVRDMIRLCRGLLNGSVTGAPVSEEFGRFSDGALEAHLETAGIIYRPDQIV